MKKIAIIPARGGSKRIPKKNIKEFFGKPVISYSIAAAFDSGLFDEVMVSTDDEEIAQAAKKFGAEIPFMRSRENSDDNATTASTLLEVLEEYSRHGKNFDLACCIYPVAPLIRIQKIREAHELLQEKKFDSVFPVVKYSYPVQRSFTLEEGKIKMIFPETINTRSQDLPPVYHDAGQFYWLNVKTFLVKKQVWTDHTGVVILDEKHAQDIDTPDDWKMAEVKYERFIKS